MHFNSRFDLNYKASCCIKKITNHRPKQCLVQNAKHLNEPLNKDPPYNECINEFERGNIEYLLHMDSKSLSGKFNLLLIVIKSN